MSHSKKRNIYLRIHSTISAMMIFWLALQLMHAESVYEFSLIPVAAFYIICGYAYMLTPSLRYSTLSRTAFLLTAACGLAALGLWFGGIW